MQARKDEPDVVLIFLHHFLVRYPLDPIHQVVNLQTFRNFPEPATVGSLPNDAQSRARDLMSDPPKRPKREMQSFPIEQAPHKQKLRSEWLCPMQHLGQVRLIARADSYSALHNAFAPESSRGCLQCFLCRACNDVSARIGPLHQRI